MNFKSILLAVAGLFALVNATSTTSPQGLDSVALAGPAFVKVDPARCDQYCHQPWLKCVADHGGGAYAELFCNCKQFSNPDNFCRHSGCVQPPQGCDKKAEAVDVAVAVPSPITARAATDGCYDNCQVPWDKCMSTCDAEYRWFCEIVCNCKLFSNPDHYCRVNNCVKVPTSCPGRKRELDSAMIHGPSEELTKKDEEPASDSVAIVGPPINPCATCQMAINSCGKGCGKPGELCAPSCQCWHKRNNDNCKGCKIKLNCDEKRRSEVSAQGLAKDDEPAAGSVALPPPPMNPCVVCQHAINSCGKDCANKGVCDDTCRCYNKMFNRNCEECKIQCDCGHACPRLAMRQRRTETSVADLEDMAPIENVLARVPNPCVICEQSIKICKKPCNGDAGCENDCNCKWKKNFNCKECSVPCNS